MLSKRGGSRTNNVSDKRGKATPANKKYSETSDLVNHHILGYNPSISHAPNRLYTSPEHKKVKKMNISYVKLGEEECKRCDFHDKHIEEIHKLEKDELSKPDENGKK